MINRNGKTITETILVFVKQHGCISGLDEDTRPTSGQGLALASIRGKTVKQHSLTGQLSQLRTAGVLETRQPKHVPSDGKWFLTEVGRAASLIGVRKMLRSVPKSGLTRVSDAMLLAEIKRRGLLPIY